MDKEKILEINNLKISFTQYQKGMQQTDLPVIKDLSVTIHAGEMVAVVGSSGSGKSLLAHGILGILPYNAEMGGEIRYCGKPLTEKNIRKLRGKEIVLVPQSTAYLDPLMKVGRQICKGQKDKEKKHRLDTIFEEYSLDKKVQEQYPFELSGGMTRRIMISTALVEKPKLVIADEPTPGLDPKLAKRAMEHFRQLADMGAAVLVITQSCFSKAAGRYDSHTFTAVRTQAELTQYLSAFFLIPKGQISDLKFHNMHLTYPLPETFHGISP